MIPFLKAVAEGYAAHAKEDLNSYCFVFPNKRARTFFYSYLRKSTAYSASLKQRHTLITPEATTITDFTAMLSGKVVDSKIDLVFLLFKCYRDLFAADASFDSFRRWGETVLNDFSEVDMNLADPASLFKNLSDFRNITSSFLTPEQRDVIEEYFGYRLDNYNDSQFWISFSDDTDMPDLKNASAGDEESINDSGSDRIAADYITKQSTATKKKFVRLWKVLYPLYERFHAELNQRGLATSGSAYREAIANIERADDNDTIYELIPFSKVVFVGFNALSGAERELFGIFKKLRSPVYPDQSFGDFVWDATGPVICHSANSAGHFVMRNIRHFPAPEWLLPYLNRCNAGDNMPELTAIAAPSKVAQVKIASDLISELHDQIDQKEFDHAKVALILPDESLLIPMLYSMPRNIGKANLTMGYPLKLTSVTSFLMLLRRMQLIRRDSKEYQGYAFEEVDNLLAHPYAQAIIGRDKIRRFRHEYTRRHIRVVRDYDLRKLFGEKGEYLLMPIPKEASSSEVCEYLDRVLLMIGEHIGSVIERSHVDAWREALLQFTDAIAEYNISMNVASTLGEAYKLLMGETIPFEGEPLKGLQIMGLLETRSLDFDHVYIISVNDKVIPMRSRKRSFLPNVIRRPYGLPPINYQENIFSYYFYRLLSRAKKVTMIYDNRASGLSGGVSRYIMQLKYLHARGKLKQVEYRYSPAAPERNYIQIPKDTPETRKKLSLFTPQGKAEHPESKPRYLSASNLKKYLACPLQFYYNAVENLQDDPAPSDGVDNLTYGNVVHHVMERLYLPQNEWRKERWLAQPIEITSEFIDDILNNDELILQYLREEINAEHYHYDKDALDTPLQFDTEIVAKSALMQIKNILRYDKELTPFNLYGCEIRDSLVMTLETGLEVNMTYAIDRIDDAQCEGNPNTVRVVDYKTGAAHTQALSIQDIFREDYKSSHLLQLLLYSHLLNESRVLDGKAPLSVKPVVYSIPRIFSRTARNAAIPSIGGVKIDYHDMEWDPEIKSTLIDEFMSGVEATIDQIFDENIDFVGRYDEETCAGCVYSTICSGYRDPLTPSKSELPTSNSDNEMD